MKLVPIGSNLTELEIIGGTRILFSYSTPVACHIPGRGFYKTSKKFSVTTSRHINKWLLIHSRGTHAIEKDQSFFEELVTKNEPKAVNTLEFKNYGGKENGTD